MKIRIQRNSVRFRLTQSELKDFAEDGYVEEKTVFNKDTTLTYSLRKEFCNELKCAFSGSRLEVCVPEKLFTVWTKTDLVSLDNQVNPNDPDAFKILVEKDFACLKERVGEDESDMFPHPDKETYKC